MFDYVDFTEVPGDSTGHDLMLFALSTCGFCKSAIAFLKEHSVQYTLAYIDRMPVQTKKRVKEEFSERFQTRMLYPTMIIDGKDTLIGFIEESWKKSLDLK